jgi:hypothetical protein
MAGRAWLEIDEERYSVNVDFLPPVGTKIAVHKNVDGGGTKEVEVTGHEWRMEPASEEDGDPTLEVIIKSLPLPRRRVVSRSE